MKHAASLLVCLFIITGFQAFAASVNSNVAASSLASQFSTPEVTWDIFRKAIFSGDFDTAKKCCCEGRGKSVFRFKKMDVEKRKTIVQSMQQLQKIYQEEDSAKYELIRDLNGVSFSTFVSFKRVNDEWKIENY